MIINEDWEARQEMIRLEPLEIDEDTPDWEGVEEREEYDGD